MKYLHTQRPGAGKRSFLSASNLILIVSLILILFVCSASFIPTSFLTVTIPTPTQSVPIYTPTPTITDSNPIPVFAYYYIWFDASSWDSKKIDYPLLGHYSSGDPNVIRQHIQWAKAAGINAFIVSWKSTPKLNGVLDQLIQISNEENFKLAINYEGLDYQRNPLPAAQVASDLKYFAEHYANQSAFQIYEKPLIIWAGTWKFTPQDVASVTQGLRDRLLILASERNVTGYQNVSNFVDGNAYYFSSVNPDTYPNYLAKLTDLGKAVHATRGLWIAPAAPGFDARLIGGNTVVNRKDGGTFWVEMNAATQSSPDAIGIISWNEFSENSYIEPSVNYGTRYLDIMTEINKTQPPAINNFDSSDPGVTQNTLSINQAVALGLLAALVIASLIVIMRRQLKNKV